MKALGTESKRLRACERGSEAGRRVEMSKEVKLSNIRSHDAMYEIT